MKTSGWATGTGAVQARCSHVTPAMPRRLLDGLTELWDAALGSVYLENENRATLPAWETGPDLDVSHSPGLPPDRSGGEFRLIIGGGHGRFRTCDPSLVRSRPASGAGLPALFCLGFGQRAAVVGRHRPSLLLQPLLHPAHGQLMIQ